jgi:mono/diheme cytochrome c family protein
MSDRLPRWVVPGLVVLSAVALVPFAFVAKSRVSKSSQPRVQMVPDMDQQPRYEAQQRNAAFADGRAMRPWPEGTVARGELREDDHLERGKVDGKWAERFPMPVTRQLIERGQERFGIFCAACHGLGGLGGDLNGMVDRRALEMEEPLWVSPTSFHTEEVRGRTVGHLYNTITNGIRTMPAYGPQIPVEDRWAIVAYVRALQRSQNAGIEDVPADKRESLR